MGAGCAIAEGTLANARGRVGAGSHPLALTRQAPLQAVGPRTDPWRALDPSSRFGANPMRLPAMTSIVRSMAYRHGQLLGDNELANISGAIAEPDTVMFLSLHEPDDTLLLKVQDEFALHALAIKDAHHAHQRPKIGA